MAAELNEPEFSFEMAGNLLQLLVRCALHCPLPDRNIWVRRVAERFCISRPRTRLLELAAAPMPPIEDMLREAAGKINEASREAMTHLVSKQHGRTLQALVELAERSLNARIINLARATLEHHGHHLAAEDASRLGRRIEALHEVYTDAGRRLVERRS